MRIFLTGASGFVGSAVTSELLAAGHAVLGLARSAEAEAAIHALGADAHLGSLEDHERLREGVVGADAVIHLAFPPDRTAFAKASEVDRRAIEALGDALAGTGKPLIVPNGLAGLVQGRAVTEDDDIPEHYPFPRSSEQTALRLVDLGVAASVVRLAQVHDTQKQGFITGLVDLARKTGISAYVGDGANRWPAVHISDAARLFRLVLEAPQPGAKYHAVAEEGVPLQVIADEIGRAIRVPVASVSEAEAGAHFGPLAPFVAQDMPASASITADRLSWKASGPTLASDLARIVVPADRPDA